VEAESLCGAVVRCGRFRDETAFMRINEAHAPQLTSPFLHTLFYTLTDRVATEIHIWWALMARTVAELE
jgi:hypothetical protein